MITPKNHPSWRSILKEAGEDVSGSAKWGDILRENPHLKMINLAAPLLNGFCFFVDLEREYAYQGPGSDYYMGNDGGPIRHLAARLYPGHRFLIECLWRGMWRSIKRSAAIPVEAALPKFRWRYALRSRLTDRYLLVDQYLMPIVVQQAPIALFGYCYVLESDYQGEPVLLNPIVLIGQQQAGELESKLREIRSRLFRRRQRQLGKAGFTRTELELLDTLAERQRTCQELAAGTDRSPETIRSHYKNILRKARGQLSPAFRDAPEVARYLKQVGLIR